MIQGSSFKVLACFWGSDTRSFVDLCQEAGYPTDLGGYYIRQLVRAGYLAKQQRGLYHITPLGKQQMTLHQGKRVVKARPRVIALLVARRDGKYVVLRRAMQPFIGVAEWPARSTQFGESLPAAAARIAKEQFGIDMQPSLVGFFRRIDMYQDFVFDDKLFAVHSLEIPAGIAIQKTTSLGAVELYEERELQQIQRPAKSLSDISAYASQPTVVFVEHVYQLSASDLAATDTGN